MNYETLIGLTAAVLTTVAFVPQILRVWRTRSTRDISLPMYLVFATGIALWLVYGLIREDAPVILANLVTFVLVLVILGFKLRHK